MSLDSRAVRARTSNVVAWTEVSTMKWIIRAPLPLGLPPLSIGELDHAAVNLLLREGKLEPEVKAGKIIYKVVDPAAYRAPLGRSTIYILTGYFLEEAE